MPDELKTQAIRSVKWNTLSIGATTILQIVQMIWLARLLDPADFGVMAMVWVVIRIASPLAQGGIQQAIVQSPSVSRAQFSTLFWVNVFLGAGLLATVNLLHPVWQLFFPESKLRELLMITSISLVFGAIGNPFQAIMLRNLAFRKLAFIQAGGAAVEFVTAVGLAMKGWGPEAIAWGVVAKMAFQALTSLMLGWSILPLQIRFHLLEIKAMLRFGLFETGSTVANLLQLQIDKALIGHFLGTHMLGLYFLCWELIVVPVSKFNPLLSRIAFPVFSRLQDQPEALNHSFQKVLATLMLLNTPFLLAMALLAKPILAVFFGPAWAEASTCLSILTVVGLGRAFASPGSAILLAKGRPDTGLYWNLIQAGGIALILWGAFFFFPSLESAALAQVAGVFGLSWIWYYFLSKYGGIRLLPLFSMLLHRIFLSLPMGIGIGLIILIFTENGAQIFWGTIAGIIVYSLTLFVFQRSHIAELFSWIRISFQFSDR